MSGVHFRINQSSVVSKDREHREEKDLGVMYMRETSGTTRELPTAE